MNDSKSAEKVYDQNQLFIETLERHHLLCEAKINTYKTGYENRTSQRPGGFCPPIWDKVMCWPETQAGETVTQPCADYNLASRKCELHSEWYVHPTRNTTWTNYSLCISPPLSPVVNIPGTPRIISEWIPIIKTISRIGYAASFITLILALVILICVKRLKCPRNTLHIHLFLSFFLRAFMALLKDQLFIDGLGLPNSIIPDKINGPAFNHEMMNWECKLVTSLWQYFIVVNYTWILMEGLYLHNLIFLAPFTDSSAITTYIILGWGCPLLVVTSWVVVRIYYENTLCWTTNDNSYLFYIIKIPIIITITLNFVFFLNIVRVLLLKLTSSVSVETRKYRYRKWAKSTLVLMPLFGVHYMVFLGMTYYTTSNPVVEVVWLVCDQLFGSFQGCLVSFLYCLINGEVRSELKKIWKNHCNLNTLQRHKQSSFPMHSSRHTNRSTNDENLTTNGLTHG